MAISDEESKSLWDYFDKNKLAGIDLILSCGDLDPRYLSFLATFTSAPVLYVHGNHDTKYTRIPPEGCICIEDEVFVFRGVRILGLGGSMCYIPNAPHQYTDRQMNWRIWKAKRQIRKHKGFDILLAHSPAQNLNDGEDLPHRGFSGFRTLMDQYHPRFFLHGHVHASYGDKYKRYCKYGDTRIINAYERYIFDYEDDDPNRSLPLPNSDYYCQPENNNFFV